MKPQPLIIIAPVDPDVIKINNRGLANGYVAVPKGHPWFGMEYNDIVCSVHGGLTFAYTCEVFGNEYWMIGFDTAHYNDSKETWPINRVYEEAMNLWNQVNESIKTDVE